MKLLSAIKYLLVLFLLAGMSCEETIVDPAFTFTIGKGSTFRMNQTYSTSDGQFKILIKEIGDSRCPEGAQCDWQGEVTLNGEWTANKDKSVFELHSVIKDMQKMPEGFTIQIVNAEPYPNVNSQSKPEDKVVTLLIQRK